MARRSRDDSHGRARSTIANDWSLPRPSEVVEDDVSAWRPSPQAQLDRGYGARSPIKALGRLLNAILTGPRGGAPRAYSGRALRNTPPPLTSKLFAALPRQTRFCVQRQQRREVMFARGVAGSRGIRKYRRTQNSQWSCK